MRQAAGILVVIASSLALFGCAATPETDPTTRTGMDRVSPVRAAEVNTRLGIGYLERGERRLAMEKLNTALRHDSEHVPAMVALALIYEELGNSDQAERHFRQAIRRAPTDGATLNSYAVFLCRRDDFDEAEGYFGRALQDPFYETPEVVHLNAGACARRSGQFDSAEIHLRRALERDAELPGALYHLAQLYYEREEAFRARAFLQRFEASGETEPAALLLGYRIESSLGNPAEAGQYVSILEERFPDSREARELRRQIEDND
ncbi:type IV pilus biogenesis/stability protein PilW [Wenzhouxiangella sp. AB-CW3]|uniref:type IV pilus biogenesis/stability protein PilW n=1 Tax=Wenzhouxiangella sp. AB-CW3 TaxID=2771012 RepID=UPI00168BED0D|nr:type IV pilus biogenesis/stability protein PilW [Wenzhouxiangella sp. AB-CW3]QOC23982.1 type IV pilus biogenesis/stability protein PilW [Wenzhouxiangella sp. AB-CW3]